MTSKYCKRIDIIRIISIEMLQNILDILKDSTIIEFPINLRQIEGEIMLILNCQGYINDKRDTKIVKLTNTQRREFITQTKCIILGKFDQCIIISSNEYTSNLDTDDY